MESSIPGTTQSFHWTTLHQLSASLLEAWNLGKPMALALFYAASICLSVFEDKLMVAPLHREMCLFPFPFVCV
jgi:hypothetical protein